MISSPIPSITRFAIAIAVSSAPGVAAAQDTQAGLGLSTLGPTLEFSYDILPNIAVRGIGFIPLSGSVNDDGLGNSTDYSFDGQIDTGAFALMADYYPNGQGWRISGGLFFAPDDLVSGTFTGDETFTGALNMERSVAPVITGGYKHDFEAGWYVAGEVGAIFSGFEVESESSNADVQADVIDINDDLDDLPAYPYIGVSVGFTF